MKILTKFIVCLTGVSSVLVNTFYPLSSQETTQVSSSDASILLMSNFDSSGSEILNKIPKISYSNWKNPNRAWIIISGIADYSGQFKTEDEQVLFTAYQASKENLREIPLSDSLDSFEIPALGKYQKLASEISSLRKIDPNSYSNYVLVINGLQEIPKNSQEYVVGLGLLEGELSRFKKASTFERPLLITTVTEWKNRLYTRQISSCAQSETECMTLYNNCSRHGKCVSRKLGKNKDCWICNCISTPLSDENGNIIPGRESPIKWSGSQCEYQDISVPFQIIFWTSIVLLLVLMSVIGMMMNTDSGDSFTGNQFEHRLKEE